MRFNSDYSVCHGDCLEVLQRVPDDSFDLSITDLPYGVTACAWDTPIDLEVMWKELLRVCKQNAAFIFTCTQPFTTALAHSKLELLRHEWIWEKPQGTNPFNAKHGPLRCRSPKGRIRSTRSTVPCDVTKTSWCSPVVSSRTIHK
jgi:site-specific DNA-methyltransferase (adenine-specific)